MTVWPFKVFEGDSAPSSRYYYSMRSTHPRFGYLHPISLESNMVFKLPQAEDSLQPPFIVCCLQSTESSYITSSALPLHPESLG